MLLMSMGAAAHVASTHDALRQWTSARGCTFGPVEIAVSSLGGGIGMFATANIDAGDVLFCVPRRLNIGLSAALSDADCGAEFKDAVLDGGAMSVLCTFIAKQYLCADSDMSPYLVTLPELSPTTCDQVQHWLSDEVEVLKGTAAYAQAVQIRQEAKEAVEFALRLPSLRERVQRAMSGASSPRDTDDLIAEAVRGAHAAVLCRSFSLEDDDPGARELIPLLDTLQHREPSSIDYRHGELRQRTECRHSSRAR